MHREGFVVEFRHASGDWVGNFQRGGTGFDAALPHPDGQSVIIVAGGEGYVIAPSSRTQTTVFGGDITNVVFNGPEQVVLSTFTDFLAFDANGEQWRTRRLSWDGFDHSEWRAASCKERPGRLLATGGSSSGFSLP